ncbi:serine--tRNA ligase [candidate division WWE3 bacterium]|jgi:seryl-tRNA synthetase|nr:serine--tRNA ligase [candidate division WWE3 bacterium]MBT7349559.1 serine--tRNA ligase [candidate division WWE3 bacterium]
MLDIKLVRENPDRIKKAVEDRQMKEVDVDGLLKADASYIDLLTRVETHRALKNKLSSDISKVDKDVREKLIKEATGVKEELVKMEEELGMLEEKRNTLLKSLPNIISEDVPFGESDADNQVIREVGTPRKFDFEPKDHIDLGKELGLIDTEKSAEVVGSRFSYIMGDAARLQFALVSFVFDTLMNEKLIAKLAKKVGNPNTKPFIPVVPPVMVRQEVMEKMDRLEPRDERYLLEQDGLVLVGSAEHTMGPMHMGETLDDEDLPKRYVGYSTAFRREAGTYGKDTRGILRVHQFDKLEMESFTTPENGMLEQDLYVAIQEYIVQKLEIPYQVVMISTGDMGKPDFRQIDINCWMPGQKGYRETHTSDYMTDFQARRLGIRYKKGGFVYMNDATALAIGRALIAIIENHQQKDGSIKIPKALHKYMGKKVIK